MIDIAATLKCVDWHKEEPAEEKQIRELIANAVMGLPGAYIAFYCIAMVAKAHLEYIQVVLSYGLLKK